MMVISILLIGLGNISTVDGYHTKYHKPCFYDQPSCNEVEIQNEIDKVGYITNGSYINHITGKLEKGTSWVYVEYWDAFYNPSTDRYIEKERIVYTVPDWTINIQEWYDYGLIDYETFKNIKHWLIENHIAKRIW